jgi:hypothetical protein
VLHVGADGGVPADRQQLYRAAPFPHRFRLPPQVRQRHAEQRVTLRVIGGGPTLLGKREPGGVGPHECVGPVAAQVKELGPDQGQGRPVIVKRAQRQAEHQPLLLIVQHPVEILIEGEGGEENRRIGLPRRVTHDCLSPIQPALAQRDERLFLMTG